MPQSTILSILLSAVVAFGLAWLHYFYKNNISSGFRWGLAFLRAATIFCVFLLLINPKIRNTQYYPLKPELLVAVDNSKSIDNFGENQRVADLIASITEDSELNDRFEIHTYAFGENLVFADSFSFSEPQTNIQNALNILNSNHKDKQAPTILITDGNQTLGQDYRFHIKKYNHSIYPLVVGDTTTHQDLSVGRVNLNEYVFLNNQFPVEMFINYSGEKKVQTDVRITKGTSTVFSKSISLDNSNNSQIIEAHLPANQIGVLSYKIEIQALDQEKNKINNSHDFAVEVIDERTRILLVSGISHPDLGAIKNSIMSNEQREVVFRKPNDIPENLEDFSLVIVYQPTSRIKNLLERLQTLEINSWIVTGPETDWYFLNQYQNYFQKEIGQQTEEFFPELNPGFELFQVQDLGFSQLPPLVDNFGEVKAQVSSKVLLYQEIQGISTETPLMAILEDGDMRKAFLFGANVWRWRADVYTREGNFGPFDQFINQLVQYLATTKAKERLVVDHKNIYYANHTIILSAQYFDQNYQFDPRGKLSLSLTNTSTMEKKEIPFSLADNLYRVDLSSLPPAKYGFTVKVEGEEASQSGTFTILDYEVEDLFTNADLEGLGKIAKESGTSLYFPDKMKELKSALLKDKRYVTIQETRTNHVSLVDWYYLLIYIVVFLSAEWIIRKYHGLI